MSNAGAEIIKFNESDGSNNEFTHARTINSLKQDAESSYCSIEDLLNIERFNLIAENDNVIQNHGGANCLNSNSCIDSDLSTVSKVDPPSSKEVINSQAADSQLDGFFVIVGKLNDLTFASNMAFALDKVNACIASVLENDSGQCKEVIDVISENLPNTNPPINSTEFLLAEVENKTNDQCTGLVNDVYFHSLEGQCNGFINGVADSPDNINSSIDLSESLLREVDLALNDDCSILKVEREIGIDYHPNGSINIGSHDSDIDFDKSLISDIVHLLNKEDLMAKSENKIDYPLGGSMNAGAHLSCKNLPINSKGLTCPEVVSNALNEEDENKIDDQLNGKIDINAKLVEVNLCTTDYNALTPASETINSKNDIPRTDVDGSTQTLRSQNVIKIIGSTRYIKIFCTECGESPWNTRYHTNPNCPICEAKTTLRCSICNKEYTKYPSIMAHLRYKCNPDATVYRCSACIYYTRVKSAFKRHVSVHKPKENIECSACGKQFGTERYLREHEKVDCNGSYAREIKCPDCSKVFKLGRHLQKHATYFCKKRILRERKNTCRNRESQENYVNKQRNASPKTTETMP